MAITLVDSAVGANNGNTTTFSIAKADLSGLANGDLVIVHYTFDVDLAATVIATGFTKVDEVLTTSGRDLTSGYFYKFMTDVAGEPATWAFGTVGSSEKCGVATAWRGVTDPGYLDVAATTNTGINDATPDGLNITTEEDDAMIISSCHLCDTGTNGYTGVAPSELTLADEVDSTSNDEVLCAVAYLEKASLGAQAIGTWPNTPDDSSSEWHCRTISLSPSVTPVDRSVDEFEGVTVEENVDLIVGTVILGTPYEDITVTEDITAETSAKPDRDIDKFETVGTEEDVTVEVTAKPDLDVDEFEAVTLVEDVTVQLAHEFVLSLSDEFADGAITTFQLDPPGIKDSGDFQAGLIHESSNPADAIDLDADKYTEIEFCFKATEDAGEVSYDFRIEGLDTYGVTPQLTVIEGGGTLSVNVHDCAETKTCLV